MNVLVTNASGAKGLVITRSLGRKNIDVINTDSERYSAAFFSRYSKGFFLSPPPSDSPNEFIRTILNYVKNNKIDVLMPVNSSETLLISKNKNRFLQYTQVPFEDYSKMIKLHDKGELAKVAEELGLPIPRTYNIFNVKDVERFSDYFTYPVVIKLKNSTSSVGIKYAFSKNEFVSKYKEIIVKYKLKSIDYPLVQEYIPGIGYGVSLLMNKGDLRAIFTHKRLREYPITGGPSTFRESVRHPEMERIAIKLLKHFDWHGVAMVEFKLDERTNRPYLIEVNPRFWGSIYQAIASGVDFPYLLYKMAVEGDIHPVCDYRIGIKTRLFQNDIRAIFGHFRKSKNYHTFIEELLSCNPFYDDIIKVDDLLPAIIYNYTGIKEIFFTKSR